MSLFRFFSSIITRLCLILVCCCFFLAACSVRDSPSQIQEVSQTISTAASTSAAVSPITIEITLPPTQLFAVISPVAATPQAEAIPVDACTLLDRADIETTIGREVLEPKNEQLANLACCSYGNPETPIISIVTVCVFVGSDAEFYAGAEAQAKEIFEQGKNNAASNQLVSGLGNDAYWDEIFNSLHVLQGKYELSIEISMDAEDSNIPLSLSKELAQRALQRLP